MILLVLPILQIFILASIKALSVTANPQYTGEKTIFAVGYSPTSLVFSEESKLLTL